MFSKKFVNALCASAVIASAIGYALPAEPAHAATATVTATRGQKVIVATLALGLVNPKKPGTASAERFALYKPGMTVGAYVDACIRAGHSRRNATADIAWDSERQFIAVQ